jgi:shikimate dehydrogenase
MVQPISGHTALVGVLGDPVRHSLSPAMHNAALAALELDWVYLALPARRRSSSPSWCGPWRPWTAAA